MLAEKIAENIEKHKDKIALWDKDKAISYGKLGDVIKLNLDKYCGECWNTNFT